MSGSIQQISWPVEKRLQFIEMCLFWLGKINRGDIIKKFGVSVPQASNDLTRYQKAAQNNLSYDPSQKRYVVTENFEPRFYRPDVQDFLSEILSNAEQRPTAQESWLVFNPEVDAMPVLSRYIDVHVMRSLVLAIYNERAIEIFYQSIRPEFPEPEWRWISPHAFQNDGFRWHLRAYCHKTEKFKYFKLSRIFEVGAFGKRAAPPEGDRLWQEYFEVVLIPNTALSPSQQKAIARQYQMRDGKLSVPVRKSILAYFEIWLSIHLEESFSLSRESPLMIENRTEFEAALAEVLT